MVQYDELLVTVFICVIGGLLLIVGLGIYFENELTSLFFGGEATSAAKPAGGADDASGRRASVPAADSGGDGGGAADQSANGGGAGFGSWGGTKQRPGDRRVYSSGVRLEELLRWPALEACRALHAYALEMSGEDTEAFFSALPQITNCILGLDHANGALNKGWLNQQALVYIYTYTWTWSEYMSAKCKGNGMGCGRSDHPALHALVQLQGVSPAAPRPARLVCLSRLSVAAVQIRPVHRHTDAQLRPAPSRASRSAAPHAYPMLCICTHACRYAHRRCYCSSRSAARGWRSSCRPCLTR